MKKKKEKNYHVYPVNCVALMSYQLELIKKYDWRKAALAAWALARCCEQRDARANLCAIICCRGKLCVPAYSWHAHSPWLLSLHGRLQRYQNQTAGKVIAFLNWWHVLSSGGGGGGIAKSLKKRQESLDHKCKNEEINDRLEGSNILPLVWEESVKLSFYPPAVARFDWQVGHFVTDHFPFWWIYVHQRVASLD